MSTASVTISHLSTEFIIVPVNVTVSGQTYDPRGDEVQFAFLANPAASPQTSDWVDGSWDVSNNALFPYLAQCLVGPSGTINPGTGQFILWIRLVDNPEIPVIQAGMLNVT